jgi:RND family efflux transporter MFP subunit
MRYILLLLCALAPDLAVAQSALPEPLTCLLRPNRSSDIGADTGAIVSDVKVRRTNRVKQGDLLVQLDDRIARADLGKSLIIRDTTSAKLKRAEAVTAGRSISAEEVGTLRAEAAMAAADYQRAKLQLDRTQILAPFDGTIADVMTEAGQQTNSQPLVQLIDTQRLRAEMVFPAEAFGKVIAGDTLNLAVDLTGARVAASVATIDDYIDASSNSFTVVAEIDNSTGAIPAGTSCRFDR